MLKPKNKGEIINLDKFTPVFESCFLTTLLKNNLNRFKFNQKRQKHL